jgi:hypothetical protein
LDVSRLFMSVSSRITIDRVDCPGTYVIQQTREEPPGVNFKPYIVMVVNEEEKNVGKS